MDPMEKMQFLDRGRLDAPLAAGLAVTALGVLRGLPVAGTSPTPTAS